MLFDLQSRGRRNTVRVIYIFLALVMIAGLVLVGVGTGTGGGGLLNAFTDNGSGNGSKQTNKLVDKNVKRAIAATQANPTSAAAWKALMQARYTQAQSGSNLNTTTGVFSAAGKADLSAGVAAWNKYLKLTHDKPDVTAALLAKGLYTGLGDYAGMSTAWQYVAQAEPAADAGTAYICIAYTAYAASNKQLGDLAAAKAVKLAPKLQKLTLKANLKTARKTATTAKTDVAENNC